MTAIVALSNQPVQEVVFDMSHHEMLAMLLAFLGPVIFLIAVCIACSRFSSGRWIVILAGTAVAAIPLTLGLILAASLGEEPSFSEHNLSSELYLVQSWDSDKPKLRVCKKPLAGSNAVTFRYANDSTIRPGIVSWNVEDNLCTVTLTAEGETK